MAILYRFDNDDDEQLEHIYRNKREKPNNAIPTRTYAAQCEIE